MPFIPRSNRYGAWTEEDTENVKNAIKFVIKSPISIYKYWRKDIDQEHAQEEAEKTAAVRYWSKRNKE